MVKYQTKNIKPKIILTEKWTTVKDENNHGTCFGVNTKPWSSGQFTTLDIRNIKVEKISYRADYSDIATINKHIKH